MSLQHVPSCARTFIFYPNISVVNAIFMDISYQEKYNGLKAIINRTILLI